MKTEKWRFSPQKGKAGHCFCAQVWDEYGGNVAVIESADIDEEATEIAKLISKAPQMLEALKQIESLCDNQNESHESIWRIANSIIKELE